MIDIDSSIVVVSAAYNKSSLALNVFKSGLDDPLGCCLVPGLGNCYTSCLAFLLSLLLFHRGSCLFPILCGSSRFLLSYCLVSVDT